MEMLYYFIKNISILGITIITGAGLATLFVSKFCWKYMDKEIKQAHGIHSLDSESESESEPENEEEKFYNDDKEFLIDYYVKFEEKYYDDFENLKNTKLSDDYKKSLDNKIFSLETPVGTVKIYYDYNYSGFKYYSKKPLEYIFLDIIFKAYAIEFDCKSLLVDSPIFQVFKLQLTNNVKKNKESEESVFLKSKNNNSNLLKLKKSNMDLLKEYGHLLEYNKIQYIGTIDDFDEKYNNNKPEDGFEKISYKEYLNLKKIKEN